MKWSRALALLLIICLTFFAATATASDTSDPLGDFLAEQLAEGDAALRTAALVALGHKGTSEQQAEFGEYKSASNEPERLAAGAALILAEDSEGISFTAEQLLQSSNTYEALRQLSVYLPTAHLASLIDQALTEASASDRRDIFRFQAAQRGALYEHLTRQLTNDDEDIRDAARQSLVHTADKAIMETLEALLKHGDASIRAQVLDFTDTLAKRSALRSSVVELLKTASRDDNEQMQLRAARQLVELGEDRGVEVLVGTLTEADSDERVETMEFLLQHEISSDLAQLRPLIEAIEAADDDERERERQLLYELAATDADDAFFTDLQEKFSSTYFEERLISVRALGRTGRSEASDLLTRGLGEGRADIRRHSARGLGQLGNPESLSDLRAALTGESNEEVRLELIAAVGQITDARSAQVLRFLVTDNDPTVRMAVVEGLETIGLPETTAALEHLLQDRDNDIKWRAFLTLLRVEPSNARPHMRSALRNPPNTFAHDIDPHALIPSARKALYETLLTHNTNRVRSAGVNHVEAHRDVLLPVARELVRSNDLDSGVRRNLVHFIIADADSGDAALMNRIVRDFTDEPAAEIAAWYLVSNMTDDSRQIFEDLANNDDVSVMSLLAKVGLANDADSN